MFEFTKIEQGLPRGTVLTEACGLTILHHCGARQNCQVWQISSFFVREKRSNAGAGFGDESERGGVVIYVIKFYTCAYHGVLGI